VRDKHGKHGNVIKVIPGTGIYRLYETKHVCSKAAHPTDVTAPTGFPLIKTAFCSRRSRPAFILFA